MVDHAWTVDVPLTTPRLELRVHRLSDLDDLVVFHGDVDVTRYIPWPVRTREQTRAALEKKLDQGAAPTSGDWLVLAIVLRESGTVIGEVLLKRGDIDGVTAEVGYVIRPDQQGKGLASEAIERMLRLAREFGVQTVDAMVDSRNAASSRLLLRLGFAREPAPDHELDDRDEDDINSDADLTAATVQGYRLDLRD